MNAPRRRPEVRDYVCVCVVGVREGKRENIPEERGFPIFVLRFTSFRKTLPTDFVQLCVTHCWLVFIYLCVCVTVFVMGETPEYTLL